MYWNPQSRYASATVPLQSREHAAELREPSRGRRSATAASPSRPSGAVNSKLFGLGHLAPVLDGEQRASVPVIKQRPPLQQRLQPLAGPPREAIASGVGTCPNTCIGGSNGSTSAARRRSTSPKPSTTTPAFAAAEARAEAREGLKFQMRSHWPNLALHGKDVAAAEQWYCRVGAQLARSFPDSRCLYAWIDPLAAGCPRLLTEKDLGSLDEHYTFIDFREGWDFPDAAQFGQWCEERRDNQTEKAGCGTSDDIEIVAFDCGGQRSS